MRTDFEIAELIWDAAESCLTAVEQSMLCVMLHSGDPLNVIRTVVESIDDSLFAVPRNVYEELSNWLRWLPNVGEQHHDFVTITTIRVRAAGMRVAAPVSDAAAGFGDATLCYFILDEAGVCEAPWVQQWNAMRRWLDYNTPGPALRVDMRVCGFGELLAERSSRQRR